MSIDTSELLEQWKFVQPEFSEKLAKQVAYEIAEAKNEDDLRIIIRTIQAKAKTEARKTALRIFKRMIKAIL